MLKIIFINWAIWLPLASYSQCEKWNQRIEIITLNEDTIIGYQKEKTALGYHLYFRSFMIKNEDCKKETIRARNIKAVLHEDGYRYDNIPSQNIEEGFKLLRLYRDGKIKYYFGEYRIETRQNTAFQNELSIYKEKVIEYHYIILNGKITKIKVKDKKFNKQMLLAFGECPKIKRKAKAKEYTIDDMSQILLTYENWLEEQENNTP